MNTDKQHAIPVLATLLFQGNAVCKRYAIPMLTTLLFLGSAVSLQAAVKVQCPGDLDGDAIPDQYLLDANGDPTADLNPEYDPSVMCLHITGGDGFVTMADGRPQYIFSFDDVTGLPEANVMEAGMLAAEFPAPTIVGQEGKQFYLSLTNVGMVIRPDLFDPHTVHFHGFPQSSTVFDGLPESGVSINMGSSLTYYYNLVEPGTYMYHCHVEATEHMQMGMLGNLYVQAAQSWDGYNSDNTTIGNLGLNDQLCGTADDDPARPCGYAYNDGDGTTAYDVEYPLQLGGFDPDFHDASWTVQPLPFAMMWDRYPMINGRGYPDTVSEIPPPSPVDPDSGESLIPDGIVTQPESSLIVASQGDRILLRLSNLNITVTHTLISPSMPMRVVGIDAKELVSTSGAKLHYTTNSVTMGGGMAADVIIETGNIAPGDYYLYAANLQYLANNDEAAPTGGMMTKIVIN